MAGSPHARTRLAAESAPAGARLHAVGDQGVPFRAPAPRSSWASNPPTRSCSPTSTRGTPSTPDMMLTAAALPRLHGRHGGRTRTHAVRHVSESVATPAALRSPVALSDRG